MPLPVVRSPLGLPLGDRGLLPLPDALPGVGAGVVAGGPYTVPQRMLDTDTGASSRTGTGTVPSVIRRPNNTHLPSNPQSTFQSTHLQSTHFKTSVAGPRAYKGSVASNRSTSGATLPFRHCAGSRSPAGCSGLSCRAGGRRLRPPAHVWATGPSGAVVPLFSLCL